MPLGSPHGARTRTPGRGLTNARVVPSRHQGRLPRRRTTRLIADDLTDGPMHDPRHGQPASTHHHMVQAPAEDGKAVLTGRPPTPKHGSHVSPGSCGIAREGARNLFLEAALSLGNPPPATRWSPHAPRITPPLSPSSPRYVRTHQNVLPLPRPHMFSVLTPGGSPLQCRSSWPSMVVPSFSMTQRRSISPSYTTSLLELEACTHRQSGNDQPRRRCASLIISPRASDTIQTFGHKLTVFPTLFP